MKYNPDLHSRRSIRLRSYNYANTGGYFVTICCRDRKCLFGEIVNEKMILNEYGKIANNTWNELPLHHSNVELCEFIAMPNHIHAILKIAGNVMGAVNVACNVMSNISPKSGTLPTIIRSYKSSVSKQIHEHSAPNITVPIWQRNYYEHIIRSETEFARIATYIRNNPILWKKQYLNTIL